MKILALWCHPRSMSTAFERVMRERGDMTVLHEPFMYPYYLKPGRRVFPDFEPDPEHPRTYEGVREMILAAAETSPVFMKDMAYHVLDALPEDRRFMAAIDHCFLIRNPAASVVSYARRDPGFEREETGIEAQWRLYEAIRAAGHSARVIRAEAVRADPAGALARYWRWAGLDDAPHALSWDAGGVPEGWESVAAWHADALESGKIRPPEVGRDHKAELEALGEPYVSYEAHHRPFYERLETVAED